MVVEIIPYQERWPEEFKFIAADLRKVLGDLALRIDHIGSTSVPGLAAKDVIDIQVTVEALDDAVMTTLTSAGYIPAEGIRRDHTPPGFTGPDSEWEKFYFQPPASIRRTHIHVRAQGRANQRYPLLFRDYLRAHPKTATAYAQLKQQLAIYITDSVIYTEVKDPAVDLIYIPAEEWAASTSWQMGTSDA